MQKNCMIFFKRILKIIFAILTAVALWIALTTGFSQLFPSPGSLWAKTIIILCIYPSGCLFIWIVGKKENVKINCISFLCAFLFILVIDGMIVTFAPKAIHDMIQWINIVVFGAALILGSWVQKTLIRQRENATASS